MVEKFYLKLYLIILIIFISIILIFSIKFFKKPLPTSFRIFYDKATPTIIDEMGKYDLNIVEATFFTYEDVEKLHGNNSKVVGYLSLVEIGSWDTSLVNDLEEGDYLLDENNQRLKSLSGSNYLGNLSSKHYREVLLKYLQTRILSKGMDGVFFDTLDWIDYYKDNEVYYNQLLDGYKAFLKELKEKFPNIILIQNRSFESYFKFSKNFIDGILWENFNSPYIDEDKDKIKILKKLNRISKFYKTNLFVISFKNEYDNRKISNKNGWNYLYSQMEGRYTNWNIIVR